MEEPFDPTPFNFVLLRDFQYPGGVFVYEYRNQAVVDGTHDFLRLNLYLTTDGNYVTIWHGIIEPAGIEMEFERGRLVGVDKPPMEHLTSCDEPLFRGYIDSPEAAAHIFKALRIGTPRTQFASPQVLRITSDNKIGWFPMSEASDAG